MSTLAPAEHDRRESALGSLVGALSLEEKVSLLTGFSTWTLTELPSIGLRSMVVSDGPIGVRGVDEDATASAQLAAPSGTAATWDEDVLSELGSLMAREAKRKGVDVVLAPVVNLQRTPVGGRHFECFSEDPLLTARLAGSFVEALQASGIGASVKHFIGNESETDRTDYTARIEERTLREVYLAPFDHVVRDAGAWTVMAAYNAFSDGEEVAPSTEHRGLLTTILKDEWGFDGVVVSDWLANKTTVQSALGGLDLEMPGPGGQWGDALVEAVRDGRVPEEIIDDKVVRILRLAQRVGALSGVPGTVAPREQPARQQQADDPAVREVLRRAAALGTVVLRNEGQLLPLGPGVGSIALLGANAVKPFVQGGGSAHVDAPYLIDPLEALRTEFPDAAITLARGGVTELNAAPIADHLLRTPTGEHGVFVQYLDETGEVVGAEVLGSARELWIRNPPEKAATVRYSTVVELAEGGLHEIEVAPVGAHSVSVNGTPLSASEDRVGAEVILNSSYSNPETVALAIDADETPTVVIEAEVQVVDGLAFGRFARIHLRHRAPRQTNEQEIAEAVELASSSDIAIVVVGTNPETESEGWDRVDLALPGDQNELVRRVAAANPRTVVVVNAGAPVLLPWLEDVAAVLWWWLPGQEAGSSLAAALSGAIEPSGRLPWTLPATEEDVPVPNGLPQDGFINYSEGVDVGHRGWDRHDRSPARPFGYGLGYTTWDYLEISASGTPTSGDFALDVRIANTGSRTGREVVQVYLESDGTDAARPVRWLAGFAVAQVDAGETTTVRIPVTRRSFEIWQSGSGWVLPTGQYRLYAGRSSRDLLLDVVVGVDTPADSEASRL
ncbi:MAG: hypothetical protein JWQ12_637 [Glaciihabitans sp.]|nr:hypothetical protein [Glaciihabitans sp.]